MAYCAKFSMPERDSWWSIFLHKAWGKNEAVDRLIDWASSVTPITNLDDEAVNLAAIALGWMLSTPNRFLRDRATKALVSLLTARLGTVIRLVNRFADVDDPYVAERVFAVAYGTAMRSHDPAEVGPLAQCIYSHVFASGEPPVHILLRDYARGVIERAIYLGADIDIVIERIRPPYQSKWPAIPTEEEIKPFLPDYSKGSHDSRDLEWARNRIGNSVMSDDFADYVIDTYFSSHWLSLRLEEQKWQSPDKLLALLLERFSEEERIAWDRFNTSKEKIHSMIFKIVLAAEKSTDGISGNAETNESQKLDNLDPDLVRAEQEKDAALAKLESVLSEEHLRELATFIDMQNSEDRHPPHFDQKLIQRYILWRVFDLGWTTELFGYFDRFYIGYKGRAAGKAERIGKKYQWIAYHEIMALVSDHFQYLEYDEHGDQAFDGPWQGHFRDIDPSSTLRSSKGGTTWHGHSPSWWGSIRYNWGDPANPDDWVKQCNDLPNLDKLLSIINPENASRWLNLNGYFNWTKEPPADQESFDIERRELWYIVNGYLIHSQDSQGFMKWAEGSHFYGRWMPEPPEYSMFLCEYGWSPAFRYFKKQCRDEEGWIQPNHDCSLKVRRVVSQVLRPNQQLRLLD